MAPLQGPVFLPYPNAALPFESQPTANTTQAAKDGVVDSARFLLVFSLVPSLRSGGSPLHIAASTGNAEEVKRLLDEGANVDEEKSDGTTALILAAGIGHVEVLKILITAGAFIEQVVCRFLLFLLLLAWC